MRLEEKYSDLTDIVKGSSFSQLFQLLWTLGTVKYATKEQLNSVNSKLATKKKLEKLASADYLSVRNNVFKITRKTLHLLKVQGYNTAIIPRKLTGEGDINEINNTSVFLQALKLTDFHALFYPHFKYLIPDACLFLKKEDKGKLVFLEIERPKPDWANYLEDKRDKYIRLAEDQEIYDIWWKEWARKLKLEMCQQEEFYFSVWCVGQIRREWHGWKFKEKI